MDKKNIADLKKKFPKLFNFVVKSVALSKIVSELDRFRYMYCLLFKKPYFGTVYLAGQTWEERRGYMKALLNQELRACEKKIFNILEVGSWAGNSAILWADVLKTNHRKGNVFCVDPWTPYVREDSEKVNAATIIMNQALKKGRVFNLFLHNIKTSGCDDVIVPVKGSSDKILPNFANESFDFIYIDGDHSYSGIMNDLINSRRILRNGGVLCGDDLDVTIDQIDREYAHVHKETNLVVDPKTKKSYHPGVCLAVAEFFNSSVSQYNGFWAMRKVGERWENVLIRNMES